MGRTYNAGKVYEYRIVSMTRVYFQVLCLFNLGKTSLEKKSNFRKCHWLTHLKIDAGIPIIINSWQ